MLCDECKKNEATFHSIRKVNGHKTEAHLCAECLHKRGLSPLNLSPTAVSVNKMLSDLEQSEQAPRIDDSGGLNICAACGWTRENYLATGYVGCEQCYTAFAPLLLPRIKKLQSGLLHVGKRPKNVKTPVYSEVDELKIELKNAIELEDFERADELSRRLKSLTGGEKV